MFFRFILLVVSLTGFLCSFHVSACDENCADKPVFSTPRLVVKFGDPTSASCSVCRHECVGNLFDVESAVGDTTKNGTTVLWSVDSLTEWSTSALCFYTNATLYQCCSRLPITVYQPPTEVSISFLGHTGPMFEGRQYKLQCSVQDVAPVQNLVVTFYRGQTALGQQKSISTEKEPVTEIFTLNFTPSKEDDGVQYWCEAKLDLGPEGPQHPPTVMSRNVTATVYYGPQLVESSQPDPITVTEGNPLRLKCSAVANPPASYTWMLPLANPSRSDSSVLTIDSVTPADEGLYICSVSNIVETVTVRFNVVVQGLEFTTTRLPPTSTPTTSTPTTSTPTTSTPTATTPPITTTPPATKTTTVKNSKSNLELHGFMMCLMLLLSVLV